MSVPTWLKCETCTWWAFGNEISYFHATTLEKQYISGCIHPDIVPQLHTCTYRCPRWLCRRCLTSLDDIIANTPDVVNHNKCKRVGRGNNYLKTSGFLTNGEEE